MTRPLRRRLCAAIVATALALGATLLATAATSTAAARDSVAQRLDRLERQLDALDEDLEDDGPAMAEFTLFDECMFLVGVSSNPGYWFSDGERRSALALDLAGPALPDFDLLAFPAEEPPGIECNEDAGEEQTDDE